MVMEGVLVCFGKRKESIERTEGETSRPKSLQGFGDEDLSDATARGGGDWSFKRGVLNKPRLETRKRLDF